MTLLEAIDAYITLKRSLGAVFSADTRILRSFARALGDIAVEDIDPTTTREFCRGNGAPTRWWERKDEALRGFFAWLVNRGHLAACPLPAHRPRVRRSFQPYIYSRDELQRLLDATAILQHSRFPGRQTTFRTLLLALYGAGLRPSEGLRLRCRDVDLRERVLTISDTKFFKSRLVPIGNALTDALSAYSVERRHLPMPAGTQSAFFASHTGKPISLGQLVDRGRPRRLPPDIAELLVGLKTEQPSFSVNALIGAARERGVEHPLAPSTVHRLLSREGLLDKRPGEPVAIDRRRFAFRYAGELWMSDVMHGPKVSDGRRRRKTFLMAFIDDATRVLPFAAFDFSESTTAFLPVLKSALTRRGLPLRLYVDNGANYRSHQLALVCAKLGIALIHARPWQPAGKGKIERFFRTLRAAWLERLDADATSSLEALRRFFQSWI